LNNPPNCSPSTSTEPAIFEALSLVRNPYSVIGDAAEKVVDADEYEEQLAEAGIYFHRFRLEPCLGEDGKHIRSIGLFLELISAKPLPEVELRFDFAHEFAPFVNELQVKLAAGMPAGFWQGYELELSDFDLAQLAGVNELLRHWQRQEAGRRLRRCWIWPRMVIALSASVKRSALHLHFW
jgi:hypothetical protein